MELGVLTKTIAKRNMNHGVASSTKKETLVAVAGLCVEENTVKFTLNSFFNIPYSLIIGQ